MNWKIRLGILLILASIKVLIASIKDARTSVRPFSPIYGELGALALMGLGLFLIYKGWQKKPLE